MHLSRKHFYFILRTDVVVYVFVYLLSSILFLFRHGTANFVVLRCYDNKVPLYSFYSTPRKTRNATAGNHQKKKNTKRRSSSSRRRRWCSPPCSFRGRKVRVRVLLFLTQQQELALVSVEPQELAAEVLDVGCQAVLPQQHGKVLQLQCTQPLTQLHEHTHTHTV